jgi:hypothetical protein
MPIAAPIVRIETTRSFHELTGAGARRTREIVISAHVARQARELEEQGEAGSFQKNSVLATNRALRSPMTMPAMGLRIANPYLCAFGQRQFCFHTLNLRSVLKEPLARVRGIFWTPLRGDGRSLLGGTREAVTSNLRRKMAARRQRTLGYRCRTGFGVDSPC